MKISALPVVANPDGLEPILVLKNGRAQTARMTGVIDARVSIEAQARTADFDALDIVLDAAFADVDADIRAETGSREAGDTLLSGRVDAEAQTQADAFDALDIVLDAAFADVDADIRAETGSREAGDTVLSGRVDAEAAAREADFDALDIVLDAAFADVDADIRAETGSREAGDTVLSGRVDAEAAAREADFDALDIVLDAAFADVDADIAAGDAALTAAMVPFIDLVEGLSSPGFAVVSQNLRLLSQYDLPPPPVIPNQLTVTFLDLVEGLDGPALATIGSNLAIETLMPVGSASAAIAAPSTSATVAAVRDPVTRCAVPARFLSGAARPTIGLFVRYGQSLSIASNFDRAGSPGDPGGAVYTRTAIFPGKVFMLNGVQGIRARPEHPFTETGLTDAIEFADPGGLGETGMVAMLNRIAEKTTAAIGATPWLGGLVCGQGGQSVVDLQRGSEPYNAMLYAIQRFRDLADAAGFNVELLGSIVIHGNADNGNMSGERWGRFWTSWRQDFVADVRALLGAAHPDVPMFIDQCDRVVDENGARTAVPLAPLSLIDRDPMIRLTPSHVDIPRDAAGTVHPSCLGYLWLGERMAETIWSEVFCGGSSAFRVTRAWWKNATQAVFRFEVPVLPLVFEASDALMPVSNLPWRGVEFDDYSGAPPAITAVIITRASAPEKSEAELTVTLASAPTGPSGRFLFGNAWNAAQWTGGPMIALRDSSAAVSSYGVDGQPAVGGNPGRPLYAFAANQVVTL